VSITIEERLWRKVDRADDGCWLWTGCVSKDGYGMLRRNGRMAMAHRVAYELLVDEIPAGLTIDHLCRVPACVNPKHLEVVTIGENVRRGRALITHCPQGHPYDEANTYRHAGRRCCRKCRVAATARLRARKRAERAMA
jgi:hypothetical protein